MEFNAGGKIVLILFNTGGLLMSNPPVHCYKNKAAHKTGSGFI